MIPLWVRVVGWGVLLGVPWTLVARALRHLPDAKRQWYRAVARTLWLQARTELWMLADARKIRVRSLTFRTLFRVQMIALHPDSSSARIARELRQILPHDADTVPAWILEQETWPVELQSILRKMACASHVLASAHAGLAASLVRWLLRSRSRQPFPAVPNFRAISASEAVTAMHTVSTFVDVSHAFDVLARGRESTGLTLVQDRDQ